MLTGFSLSIVFLVTEKRPLCECDLSIRLQAASSGDTEGFTLLYETSSSQCSTCVNVNSGYVTLVVCRSVPWWLSAAGR